MFMNLRALTLALVVLCLAACETTTFSSTWKDPNTPTLDPVGKKVAAVFVSRDEAKRRAGETLLANDISRSGAIGVPAYSLVPDSLRGDGDKARAALKEAGATAAVVMRVVGKDQQVNYTPGTTMPAYYGGFGPYWGYGWGSAYSPGYVTTDTIVSVETLIYSLTQDKLLWASTSRTTNPGNLDQLVTEVANATAQEMVRQGMLPGKK
jgi:hypothetical protein